MKYGPHKSSLFDLDANIVALLIYLFSMLIGFINDSLSSIAWIIPLIAFILEKESSFVVFHAANSLTFYVIKAILYFITVFLSFSTFLTVGILDSVIARFLIMGFIFILIAINFAIFVITVISMIKAYNYQEIRIPVINKITNFIINLKR